MKKFPLFLAERTQGFTHGFVLDHTDLTEATADTAQAFDLMTLPAQHGVLRAGFSLLQNFEDASDAAFNDVKLSLGDEDAATSLMTAQQVAEKGTTIEAAVSNLVKAFPAAKKLRATFGSMDAKSLSDIDKGRVVILLQIVDLGGLAKAAV